MSDSPSPSKAVTQKAIRLLEQRRVQILDDARCLVAGDTGTYLVEATEHGVSCECAARDTGQPGACAHRVAAMAAWQEQRIAEAGR
jgi:hypothetical protein